MQAILRTRRTLGDAQAAVDAVRRERMRHCDARSVSTALKRCSRDRKYSWRKPCTPRPDIRGNSTNVDRLHMYESPLWISCTPSCVPVDNLSHWHEVWRLGNDGLQLQPFQQWLQQQQFQRRFQFHRFVSSSNGGSSVSSSGLSSRGSMPAVSISTKKAVASPSGNTTVGMSRLRGVRQISQCLPPAPSLCRYFLVAGAYFLSLSVW